MNTQIILEELLDLLEKNNVSIRREPLGGSSGGLTSIKGHNFFFLDTQASAADSAALCADALSKTIDIEKIYIRPEIRQFIEKHSKQKDD